MPTSNVVSESGRAIPSISWKRELGGGFEYLSLASLRKRKLDHRLSDFQRLKFHLLIFYRQGHGKHMVDFTEHECPPNSVIHISPNQVHAYGNVSTSEAEILVFQKEVLTPAFFDCDELPAIPEFLWPPFVRLTTQEAAFLARSFQLLAEHQKRFQSWKEANSARHHALAIASFCRQASVQHAEASISRASDPRYLRFADLMEGNFRTQHSAMWYAREVGCSYKTLCRVCETTVGLTPKALLDERVFMEARRLLGFSHEPVYEIADELGFSESTNFIKFFQRLADETPEAFRRRWQR